MPDREITFTCDCSSLDHSIRFTQFAGDDEIYVDIVLRPDRQWWRRILTAFRYVFTGICGFGSVSEMVLSPEKKHHLCEWLHDR